MSVPITGLYAAVLTLLIVVLAARVVFLRRTRRVGLGSGGDSELARAIRAHGNQIEIVPITLLLLLVIELGGAQVELLHGLGITLIVGRHMHAWGLSHYQGKSLGRFWGTVLTWAAAGVAGTTAVLQWFG